MNKQHFIFNGELIYGDSVPLSLNDRGLNYGDGLFETMISENGTIRFIEDHLKRLQDGAKALSLLLPESLTAENVKKFVTELIEKNAILKPVRIKLILWRTEGGYYTPTVDTCHYLITAEEYNSPVKNRKSVGICEGVRLHYSPISKFKTLNSLPYILAGRECIKRKYDDLILLDADGNVAECIASNIFWIKNNTLFTPSLATGCVEGIMRNRIIKACRKLNIKLIEIKTTSETLSDADFIFTSNTTGCIPVTTFLEKNFPFQNNLFIQTTDYLNITLPPQP